MAVDDVGAESGREGHCIAVGVGKQNPRGDGVSDHGLYHDAVGPTFLGEAIGDLQDGVGQLVRCHPEFGSKRPGCRGCFGVFGGRRAAHCQPLWCAQAAEYFGDGWGCSGPNGVGVDADHGKDPESARFQSVKADRFVAKDSEHV